ncbi:retrotransposon protein, putative, ty1-copia subclass [Tanacetum coccineum]|uniref:Retrotransposon protein, putative, ty1-copia subclass n=1 Tax=Tanacetum coccineum TaxID=301880 RepID=A0ABQ5GWF6_9ASTR
MKDYIDNLERLGHPVSLGLAVSLILISLRKEFDGFVHNYNMHNIGKTVNELHAMLKLHEQTLAKNNALTLYAIRARKQKNKLAYAPKPKIPPQPKREDPAKDYVYDTGCGTHIYNTTQGLRASRKLKPGALRLYMGNGQRAEVEAIRSYYLSLPSGLVIVLNNYHYDPSITRGVISVSCLYDNGYINRFVDNSIQVSRNNMVYFSAVLWDGIFEIDLSDSYTNVSWTLLFYGIVVLDTLVRNALRSCNMIDFSIQLTLRLSKNTSLGASYFITFTDDFSLYGYVYLLKHKHEVFETFKVFQKEVENQLSKTIKSLRSDRGGEYMSQEFLDHLKDYGIIAHRTPPYTPQHNGYPKETMGYSFYYPPKNKLLVARNAEFLESSLITQEASGSLEDLEIIQEEDAHPSIDTSLNYKEDNLEIDEPQSDINPIRRSTRTRRPTDLLCLYIDVEEHELGDLGEPANYKAALLDPESDKWLSAMNWLFKKKTDMDGVVYTYKARFVAKGYTQTSEIDYEETFSPVANIRAIRILIAITAFYDYEIWQMDVKMAFLNGYLSEERYHMENYKRGSIPMHEKLRLSKSQGASTPAKLKCMQNVPYASAVGDLHWTTVKNIMKYLRNTKDMFLVYGGAVDWKSVKQSIFATSSAKTEYIAAYDASKEAVWVRKFIYGLGIVPTIEEPINMYCDNTRAITTANESGITKGARHFHAKVHYLGEVIEFGDIKLEKVHTDDNLADPFTKTLAFPKHSEHTKNIGMLPASSLM